MTGLQEATFVLDHFADKYEFSKGILQAIGYKEFFEYYQEEPMMEEGQKKIKLEETITKLCTKTLQYASYQMKWLTKRIQPLFGTQ